MSAASPPAAETLMPPTISSEQLHSPEVRPERGPGTETNPPEKRKREEVEPDQPPQNPLWKTTLCSYFRRSNGSCSHGDSCRFAHGESELRPRPDNSWDPTSERVKKMARLDGEDASTTEDADKETGNEVMMTDAVAEEDGSSSDSKLAKCFVNLPMKWGSDKLKTFLREHAILFKTAKKKEGMLVGFVTFENEEQVRIAEELEGTCVGNKTLKVADVIPRSFEKQNTINSDSVVKARSVRSVVTPLADMPYPDQLDHKKSSLVQTLKKLTRNARKACPSGVSLPEWIMNSREIGGLPCKLENVVSSPCINGYRNKCEFSVGYSLKGTPCVGFQLGNFREGVTAVEEPLDCPNVSLIACRYASIFQEYLQHTSLPIWNRLNNTGFWRQLTVREGRTPGRMAEDENPESPNISEVMLMVQICSAGLDSEVVDNELQKMAKAFAHGAFTEFPVLPLTSLVVQDHTGISNVAPSDAPLRSLPILNEGSDNGTAAAGETPEAKIHDYINGLRFCISPTAFFQVNTLAAEKLYSLAGEWAGLGPDTLLFDICCGTGTIGLTLSHRVGMVVGIEMNASAVQDAQRNADINGIKNCRFICAKAEDVLGSVLREYLDTLQIQEDLPDRLNKNDSEQDGSVAELLENGNKDTEKQLLTQSVDELTEPVNKNDPGNSPSQTIVVPEEDKNVPDLESDEKVAEEMTGDCNKDTKEKLPNSGSLVNTTTKVQTFKNIVAIVDPPRMGLHPTVTKVLRTNERLKRLVYISCNPESLMANAIELCTPSADSVEKGNNNNNRGWKNMSNASLARQRTKSMPKSEPFKPVKAIAVDLFPHTPHCELVMLLER
ncbi:unnamed protein product [Cuscuta campestris]|uniref:C3H1-type domain-containing protein n=1 Tax=Cuscuta campestris TaxID=132261 RepID=A0A484N6Q4_9ASTE|nr:unnamed protein product [Cuscuta campestris]VFQ96187.1 unnamed protein product [Cuscuta campestris]